MSDSLKGRVRQKLLRQLTEDGRRPVARAEQDDQRLKSIQDDLESLEVASDGDQLIEDLASKYWVP